MVIIEFLTVNLKIAANRPTNNNGTRKNKILPTFTLPLATPIFTCSFIAKNSLKPFYRARAKTITKHTF